MKNKKGKKLVVLGAMAALLTLIGVSGSQTYAKYVESTTVPSQTATVAKWGVVQQVNANNLFGKNYGAADGGLATTVDTLNKDGTISAEGVAVTAKSLGANKIVQPGGSGSLTFGITGQTEVKTQIDFDFTFNSDIFLDTYNPMKWTLVVSGTGTAHDNTTYGDLETVLDTLGNVSHVYGPNEDAFNIQVSLSWVWEYYVDDATDILDTKLAVLSNKADSTLYKYAELDAEYTDDGVKKYSTDVSFGITMTATQVQ